MGEGHDRRRSSRRWLSRVVAPAAGAQTLQPLDKQHGAGPVRHELGRLQADPGHELPGPGGPADGQEVEGRAGRSATSRTALLRHAGRRARPSSATRRRTRSEHPARRRRPLLRRLPQQAAGAEQLPDHEPVLDGGLLRQVRRRPRRRSARTALDFKDYQYWAPTTITARRRRATPCNKNFTLRRCGRSGRPTSARPRSRVRQHLLASPPARTRAPPGRSSATAKFLNAELDPGRLRPEGARSDAAQLGLDALRAVDLVGRALERVAERVAATARPRPRAPGMATYAHELSHNLSIPDNYNNPFGDGRSSAPRPASGT